MLAFSAHWANDRTVLKLSDAARLPFDSESVDLLISSLGDPYNDLNFWKEVGRVLKPDGHAIFTTPSHEWSVNFRSKLNSEKLSAEFELKNGETVSVPSFIYSREQQADLLKQAGLQILEYKGVPLAELSSEKISPKLLIGNGKYIVEGYLVKKA